MAHETDRLNRALALHLKDGGITDRVCPVHGFHALLDEDDEGVWRCTEITGLHDICRERAVVAELARDYCGSLDAAVEALNALGLKWSITQGDGVSAAVVWRTHATGRTPAALAMALVRAALEILGKGGVGEL